MIIDAVLYLDELEMLKRRLEYLYDHVDFFVIVESDITFSGKRKPFNLRKAIADGKIDLHFLPKIVYCPFRFDEKLQYLPIEPAHYENNSHLNSGAWITEKRHRDYFEQILSTFDQDDIILFGDIDEIPLVPAISFCVNALNSHGAVAMEQWLMYYNFHKRSKWNWVGTVACTNAFILDNGPQWVRENRVIFPRVHNAGYHLSYFMSPEAIKAKIKSFAHTEYDSPEFTDTNAIQRRIDEGIDPFDRPTEYDIVDCYRDLNPTFYSIFKDVNISKKIEANSVPGWFDESDFEYLKFAYNSIQDGSPKLFVEVGSFLGRSASYMGELLQKADNGSILICVDPWEDDYSLTSAMPVTNMYEQFLSNTRKYKNVITPHRSKSVDGAKIFDNASVDAIFIDGLHDYTNVSVDITAWLPKMKPRSIMGGHDWMFPDVQNAVKYYFKDKVKTYGNCWYVEFG